MKRFVECPAEEYTCPYCDANAHCMMYPDSDPYLECDTFYFYWAGEYEAEHEEEERTKQNLREKQQSKDLAEDWDFDDCDNDCGFDPYLGCFTDDC